MLASGKDPMAEKKSRKAAQRAKASAPIIVNPFRKLIFYSLGMPSARKLLISLRAVVEYFKM
jgi:hypothetical protein